jgi:ABC-type branched-subunit amino acid transport system substrate-binding protein
MNGRATRMTNRRDARSGPPVIVRVVLAAMAAGWGGCGPPPESPRPAQRLAPIELKRPAAEPGIAGKRIYRHGVGVHGDALIAVLNSDVEVPAATVPCANCHGIDGRGNSEGALSASDITWESLTKPYGATESGARIHRAYDEATLRRAITMGYDASGQVLQAGMPRYRLSHRDLDDLIAYLKRLGRETDPGVTESTIRIGVMLPPDGPGAVGRAVNEVLTAYFGEINGGGGIYDRAVELRSCASPADADNRAAALAAFCDREQPFAMVGVLMAGAEDRIAALVCEREVPLVGPISPMADVDRSANRYVFYLTGGLDRQARALAGFARRRGWTARHRIGLVTGEGPLERKLGEVVASELGRLRADPLRMAMGRLGADEIATGMRAGGIEVVFCLVAGDGAAALLRAARRISWRPVVLAIGANLPDVADSPKDFEGALYLALPYQPTDRTTEGLREYRALAAKAHWADGQAGVRLTVLAAAKILVEALRGAGRGLTREALIRSLERPGGFSTGLIPPVSYADGRRVGAPGVPIVQVDLADDLCRTIGIWGNLRGEEEIEAHDDGGSPAR